MPHSNCISVVIPSHNRANILERTVPTYLQDCVGEVIVVDDASTDNTAEVMRGLMRQYPRIRYLHNEVNSKQGFTKNRGIEAARFEYIYFGDDDSIILPGTITRLLDTKHSFNADIVGAKALYAQCEDQIVEIEKFVADNDRRADDPKQIVDLSTLRVDFSLSYKEPIEVPFVQACFMVSTRLARELLFDTRYQGNAYREETDFLIRAALAGKKIIYDSVAVQINLPRSSAHGGAHASTSDEWYRSAVKNNDYFLDKNYAAMQVKWDLPNSIEQMRMLFDAEMQARYRAEHRYDWLRKTGLYKPFKAVKNWIGK